MATYMLSKTQVPYTGPYSIEGNGKHKGPTALSLKRAMSRLGYIEWEPASWDQIFNKKLEAALDKWDKGKDGYGEDRYDKIRKAKVKTGPNAGEFALDSTAIDLIKDEAKAVKQAIPDIGPLFHGGAALLYHDLTHPTDGVPLYPAFDDAFMQGTGIIAPENLTITDRGHSRPGYAIYATGASKLRYWFGHLDRNHAPGLKFSRGDLLGRVAPNHEGGGPHCHCGVNVELLWGAGKQFLHHDNYTHGAPTMLWQMQARLL